MKHIQKTPEQRIAERTEEKLAKIEHLNAKIIKLKENSFNENHIADIENALLFSLLPKDISAFDLSYSGTHDETVAVLTYCNKGELHTKTGIVHKRKNDVYNRRLGQILALIDCINKR
jgi:hypothetical protein